MPMTSSSWRRANIGANHFAAGHSRHRRPEETNRSTKGAGLMQSVHSRGDAIYSYASALTFSNTYSVLAIFSSVPAYLEYTTFSPLCHTQARPQQQPSKHHLDRITMQERQSHGDTACTHRYSIGCNDAV